MIKDPIATTISIIALLIVLLKEFIIPWIFKPKFEFAYKDKPPFRRENVLDRNTGKLCTFLRFSAKNVGGRPAQNCRCQVESILENSTMHNDYEGFPLRWASRPELALNEISGERLNIGIHEKEYVDIASTIDLDECIHLEKYHTIPIGIPDKIDPGTYSIKLIFSGDNFKPYFLDFEISKENSRNPKNIQLTLNKATQNSFFEVLWTPIRTLKQSWPF